jgi:DNA replication protein DnaC
MSLSQAKNQMLELNLRGMLSTVDTLLAEAIEDDLAPSDFLDGLIQSEYDYRLEKRVENKIKTSKLKIKPELEDIDYTVKRSLTKTQMKELYNLKWVNQGRAMLIIGPTGVGKTFIAQALGLHACRNSYNTLFMSLTTLIENIEQARSTSAYLKYKDKLAKPDLLIIDDFGLRKLSAKESQDFCEIIEDRSIDKATILTSQLPLENWKEVIPDPVIADAIIDRLLHTSIKLTITGESYRKIKGMKLDKETNKT